MAAKKSSIRRQKEVSEASRNTSLSFRANEADMALISKLEAKLGLQTSPIIRMGLHLLAVREGLKQVA